MSMPKPAAQAAILRDLVPRRFRSRLSDTDAAGIASLMGWMHQEAQCEQVALPHLTHRGRQYLFARERGVNVSGIEFALCDDLYNEFLGGNLEALYTLSACMWRERDPDAAAALRRGDERVPLYSKEEAEARARALRKAPPEMHMQALMWFAGLKLYVHRIYGAWLFEEQEADGDEADAPEPQSGGPDFGWWGQFLQVAEAGVFGNLQQVYQTTIHDICIYLVKKHAEHRAAMARMPQPAGAPAPADDY